MQIEKYEQLELVEKVIAFFKIKLLLLCIVLFGCGVILFFCCYRNNNENNVPEEMARHGMALAYALPAPDETESGTKPVLVIYWLDTVPEVGNKLIERYGSASMTRWGTDVVEMENPFYSSKRHLGVTAEFEEKKANGNCVYTLWVIDGAQTYSFLHYEYSGERDVTLLRGYDWIARIEMLKGVEI